jgi:NTE family protein
VARTVAFVLGGGGQLGAGEVGMLRALLEHGVRPDLVVGTSVGALNGAAVAARPDLEMLDRLRGVWLRLDRAAVFSGSVVTRATNLLRARTAIHTNESLRRLIEQVLPVSRFEDLAVPFQCVAACIERAEEHWFSSGPLVDAILASTAVPGLLPPVEVNGEHFLDGGLVNSIPVNRAVELGATDLFVLHVGRVERPLQPPANLLQVALVSFEIARRHRFEREMRALPTGVIAHVLPTGMDPPADARSRVRYRDASSVSVRIERAYGATGEFLDRLA